MFFREFAEIVVKEVWLSAEYTVERHAFSGAIHGKSKLHADYSAKRHAFPRFNPQKGMPFRELFCIKGTVARDF
jgi:hypothetical protein